MNVLKVLVIISFVLITIVALKFQPEIHHPMIIEDADFKLTRISDSVPKVNTTVKTSKAVQPTKIVEEKKVIKTEPQKVKTVETSSKKPETKITKIPIKKEEKTTQVVNVKTPNTESFVTLPEEIKEVKKPVEKELSDEEMLSQILKGIEEQHGISTEKTSQTKKNPYMTEQEEIIAWNKWRSDLLNKIMSDTDIEYAPLGTLYPFTFVVDKYGNISNVKVTCSDPNFANIAKNNIKPAILKQQKKPILNFPKGSQRTSTVVVGTIAIGTETRYTTPEFFSDYERVRR